MFWAIYCFVNLVYIFLEYILKCGEWRVVCEVRGSPEFSFQPKALEVGYGLTFSGSWFGSVGAMGGYFDIFYFSL